MRLIRQIGAGRIGPAVFAAVITCAGGVASARTIYVDDVNGNNNWDGLCEEWDGGTCGPKQTIKAGIAIAEDGDDVCVADGVYAGSGNYSIVFYGRAINVHSKNGPDNCTLDLQHNGYGVLEFNYSEPSSTVFDGFTVLNCDAC